MDQALPAACPACGAILAKLAQKERERSAAALSNELAEDCQGASIEEERWFDLLLHVPPRVDRVRWWGRAALLSALLVWGLRLIGMDHRTGEMGNAFLHGPLLVFHEAGHVVFSPFGEWLALFGGTLGQLLMPAIMGGALLLKNRDPFGASIGVWLFGVSVLDVAPYVYDALHPQLVLLSGETGDAGGHDWIYLLSSMGLLTKAQVLGTLTHRMGALLVILSLAWGAWVLRLQWDRMDGNVLHEEDAP